MFTVKAYLPVVESFGLTADLRRVTRGQAYSQSVLHHWNVMDGNMLDTDSPVGQIVRSIRNPKGLKVCITSLPPKYLAVFLHLNTHIFTHLFG
jgi:elongation factor 2